MSQVVAMLAMVIDHWGFGTWGYCVGRLAMPIYTFRQVGGIKWKPLLLLALLSEVPFYLVMNEWGNIVWLYVGGALVREGLRREPLPQAGDLAQKDAQFIIGAGVLGAVCTIHPGWLVWLVPMFTRDRVVWYGWFAGIALALSPTWALHLLGYEIARFEEKGGWRVPRPFWWAFYPAHLMLIAGLRGL